MGPEPVLDEEDRIVWIRSSYQLTTVIMFPITFTFIILFFFERSASTNHRTDSHISSAGTQTFRDIKGFKSDNS